jgi:nucleotide-binding universal stress UspA family protein
MNFGVSRILVPVDFSSHSEAALRYAAALAARVGGALELLHVTEAAMAGAGWASELSAPALSSLRENLEGDAQRQLAVMAEAVAVPVGTTIREGVPAQTIIAFAQSMDAELIVMGTHGHTGLAHTLMGSVTEHVLRHAACPVLTLRDTEALGSTTPALTTGAALLRAALGHLGTSRE